MAYAGARFCGEGGRIFAVGVGGRRFGVLKDAKGLLRGLDAGQGYSWVASASGVSTLIIWQTGVAVEQGRGGFGRYARRSGSGDDVIAGGGDTAPD